jgi:hypothetical protein
MTVIDRLLDEAEKAQRKGHLLLAEVCRDAADELGLVIEERNRLREMNERLMAAVWMVGNMDTDHDKCAWWATFDPLWKEVAQEPRVQEWADRAALGETGHE